MTSQENIASRDTMGLKRIKKNYNLECNRQGQILQLAPKKQESSSFHNYSKEISNGSNSTYVSVYEMTRD